MKLAIVIHRYGKEINGGAEYHARLLANKLATKYDIEILTTCAFDYVTWQNHYEPGVEMIDGTKVHRFPVAMKRIKFIFDFLYDVVAKVAQFESYPARNFSRVKGVAKVWVDTKKIIKRSFLFFYNRGPRFVVEKLWMFFSGPLTPQLREYIKQHGSDYDCFLFFSFMYPTTFMNMRHVRGKVVLIPTAHTEPGIYQENLDSLQEDVNGLIFNTPEEKSYFLDRFPKLKDVPQAVAGIGLDLEEHDPDAQSVGAWDFSKPYLLYLGRIEELKGCSEMFRLWKKYKAKHPGDLTLVLAGKDILPIPKRDDVVHVGFVSEKEKSLLLSRCELLWMPSIYESLSIVVLEAWAHKKPVLVNWYCKPLRGQVARSEGGLYYKPMRDFPEKLNRLLDSPELRAQMGASGERYYATNYTWNSILNKIEQVIKAVTEGKNPDNFRKVLVE